MDSIGEGLKPKKLNKARGLLDAQSKLLQRLLSKRIVSISNQAQILPHSASALAIHSLRGQSR